MSDIAIERNSKFFSNPTIENNFFALKFPFKLWRIINDCSSGAVRWGSYGKTILLNCVAFQAEYLDCDVPKFKTRNMTSFIRQLNMYGFKKLHNPKSYNFNTNVHEFFHEHFRFGRPDLLHLIKRRVIPLKVTRGCGLSNYKMSQRELCRKEFEKSLIKSRLFHHCWEINSSNQLQRLLQGSEMLSSPYKAEVICAENLSYNTESGEVVLEIDEKFSHLVLDDPNEELDLEKTEDEENEVVFCTDTGTWVHSTEFNGESVQVKSVFDGSSYIINVYEEGIANLSEYESDPDIDVKEQLDPNQSDSAIMTNEETSPSAHDPDSTKNPSDSDLFNCLSTALNILD